MNFRYRISRANSVPDDWSVWDTRNKLIPDRFPGRELFRRMGRSRGSRAEIRHPPLLDDRWLTKLKIPVGPGKRLDKFPPLRPWSLAPSPSTNFPAYRSQPTPGLCIIGGHFSGWPKFLRSKSLRSEVRIVSAAVRGICRSPPRRRGACVSQRAISTRKIAWLSKKPKPKKSSPCWGTSSWFASSDQGGMGVVYLGHQISLDRTCAVKVLSKELAEKPGFVERFIREARSMAKIDHPNVVRCSPWTRSRATTSSRWS